VFSETKDNAWYSAAAVDKLAVLEGAVVGAGEALALRCCQQCPGFNNKRQKHGTLQKLGTSLLFCMGSCWRSGGPVCVGASNGVYSTLHCGTRQAVLGVHAAAVDKLAVVGWRSAVGAYEAPLCDIAVFEDCNTQKTAHGMPAAKNNM
jgi:hypothetical protein